MLTAKEYLTRLRNLNIMIKHKQKEVDDLRVMATATGGSGLGERVMTSKKAESYETKVIKYADLEREIDSQIDDYINLKHTIIDDIHRLSDSRYIDLLYKRYVENKRFKVIAKEMHYNYSSIRILHLESLDAFQSEILNSQHFTTYRCGNMSL